MARIGRQRAIRAFRRHPRDMGVARVLHTFHTFRSLIGTGEEKADVVDDRGDFGGALGGGILHREFVWRTHSLAALGGGRGVSGESAAGSENGGLTGNGPRKIFWILLGTLVAASCYEPGQEVTRAGFGPDFL